MRRYVVLAQQAAACTVHRCWTLRGARRVERRYQRNQWYVQVIDRWEGHAVP